MAAISWMILIVCKLKTGLIPFINVIIKMSKDRKFEKVPTFSATSVL